MYDGRGVSERGKSRKESTVDWDGLSKLLNKEGC